MAIDPKIIDQWRDVAEGYCDDVLEGRKTVGRLVMHACRRHRADLDKADDDGYPFRHDEIKAVQAIMFFGFLRHTDGEYAGKPFDLYPWQAFCVWVLFGWVKKDSGLRRFKNAFLSMGRGNGKTPFGAALLLLVFAFDSPMEARAECYTCATKKNQAALSFNQAKRYVEASPALTKYINVLTHNLSIPSNYSSLEKLSSDGKTADGLNIHGLLRDELHAWTAHQREFLEKLNTALGKRRQPLAIDITTAGSEESELWLETYEYCVSVVDQDTEVEADDYFVLIYEMDDDDDETTEDAWTKANPMLEYGVVKVDYLQSLATRAEFDATKRAELRRYHANKMTASIAKPITRELWARGNEPLPPLAGRTCYAGFDWGWRDDLASLALVFPLDWLEIEGDYRRRYAIVCDVWACDHGGRRDLKREPWRTWVRDELMYATQSETTDTRAIYEMLDLRRQMYGIRSIAYDPNNAREFGSTCENEYGLETFDFGQTCSKFNEPTRELILALQENRIIHGGNPVLGWAATNLVTREDSSGLIMPWKKRAQDKIDPIVAVIMALSEAMFGERKAKPSVYEQRGPLVL